jgi:hypothetical protein
VGIGSDKSKYVQKSWLQAVRRLKWEPFDSSIACRAHFRADDYRIMMMLGEFSNLMCI